MKKHILKSHFPKILSLTLVLVSVLLALTFVNKGGFSLDYNQSDNQPNEALAQEPLEPGPIICKKNPTFKLLPGVNYDNAPDEAEIPIGETADKSQSMAKEIIEQLQKIIDAVPIEIRAAKKMAALSDRCSSHMCVETGGGNCHWEEDCETDPDTGEEIDCDYFCEVDPCGGRACPALCVCPANFDILCAEGLGDSCPCPPAGHSQAECNCKFEEWNLGTVPPTPVYYACPDLQSIIEEQVNTIGKAFKKIDDFFSEKKHVPVGIWFCSCSEEGHVGMCTIKVGVAKIEVGSCKTEVGHINELLELSRSGDYLYLSFHLNVTPPILKKEWNHQPPGLKDCVVRPAGEAGAAHRGEELVRIPFRCKDLLPDLIGECYGITECLNKCTIGEENCLPKCPNPFDDRCPCPRFENFHCCE